MTEHSAGSKRKRSVHMDWVHMGWSLEGDLQQPVSALLSLALLLVLQQPGLEVPLWPVPELELGLELGLGLLGVCGLWLIEALGASLLVSWEKC